MNIPQLPVSMFPLKAPAAETGGFVVAVLVGLTLFAVHQIEQKQKQQNKF
jgi:hypothetical protein